jgi:hypothetical protein
MTTAICSSMGNRWDCEEPNCQRRDVQRSLEHPTAYYSLPRPMPKHKARPECRQTIAKIRKYCHQIQK